MAEETCYKSIDGSGRSKNMGYQFLSIYRFILHQKKIGEN